MATERRRLRYGKRSSAIACDDEQVSASMVMHDSAVADVDPPDVRSVLGWVYFKDMMEVLLKKSAWQTVVNDYRRPGHKTWVFPDKPDNKWWMEIAGSACVDWSFMSNQLQLLGATCRPFAIWVAHVLLSMRDVLVHENVP
eukprot:2731296-Pyramimonas_sp.AAC.1